MSDAEYLKTVGHVLEESAWLARKARESFGPFPSAKALHIAFHNTVLALCVEQQLALIRSHPDLVDRIHSGLTKESVNEHNAAGLLELTTQEKELFRQHNISYRAKFGFPFVICARLNKKQAILEAFPRRLQNEPSQERATAIDEILKIASIRLNDVVLADSSL